MRQTSNNYMLLKDEVGKARRTTKDLPGQNFTYGKAVDKDKFNVGALTSSWVSSEWYVKPTKPGDKDYQTLNKLATKYRVTTCQNQTKLRQQMSGSVRLKHTPKKNPPSFYDNINRDQNCYGMPNRPSTPLRTLIEDTYGRQAFMDQTFKNEINEQIMLEGMKFYGPRQATAASQRAACQIREVKLKYDSPKKDEDAFKLKQFSGIKSRVPVHVNKNNRPQSAKV